MIQYLRKTLRFTLHSHSKTASYYVEYCPRYYYYLPPAEPSPMSLMMSGGCWHTTLCAMPPFLVSHRRPELITTHLSVSVLSGSGRSGLSFQWVHSGEVASGHTKSLGSDDISGNRSANHTLLVILNERYRRSNNLYNNTPKPRDHEAILDWGQNFKSL